MAATRDRIPWLTARPIAHRGLHDMARGRPENTLSAFRAAIDANYAIECDLHPSADGVPIVFHDDDLRRLTGAPGSIRDRGAAELRKLSIHATSETIPTLDDLLDLVKGRVPLVIELKHVPDRDNGFAAAVVERLAGYNGQAALMSFDTGLIADIQSASPHMPCGLTAEGGWSAGFAHLRTARQLGVDFISYSINHLPNPAMQIARTVLRIPLICWTVRNPAQRASAAIWSDQITFEGFTP